MLLAGQFSQAMGLLEALYSEVRFHAPAHTARWHAAHTV
jgi:hypothetical protein